MEACNSKERFVMSERVLYGQDPENLSKKGEGRDFQRSWSSAWRRDSHQASEQQQIFKYRSFRQAVEDLKDLG